MEDEFNRLRLALLELSKLTTEGSSAEIRREARVVLLKAANRLLCAASLAVSGAAQLEERILQLGVLLPADSPRVVVEDWIREDLRHLRSEFRRLRAMRRRTDGRSSMH